MAASPDKRVLDVGIKGQRVRVLGRSGVARLVLQKIELSLGVEKCQQLGAWVKVHSSDIERKLYPLLRVCSGQ